MALDRSVEARRNKLLAKEAEEVEKALKAHEEMKRIEKLKDIEKLRFKPDALEVDQLLDGEITSQVVVQDSHTVLSSKGVVVLNKTPGKMATFNDLTTQELSNYVCFNLDKYEQALQMFDHAKLNPAFDANTRAKLVQRCAMMEKKDAKDFRMIQLVQSIEVKDLSKKNLANLIWALGGLYEAVPKSLAQVFAKLLERFVELVPVCNSMNLAYAAQGLGNLKVQNDDLANLIASRFTSLMEAVEIPKTAKPATVSYLTVPVKGPSFFYSAQDLSIPQTLVPAYSLLKVLRFLKKSRKTDLLPYFYLKSAQIISNLSLYEFDKIMLLDGLQLFASLPEQQLANESIKKCVTSLAHLSLSYYQEFTVSQVSLVARALVRTKAFRYTAWFRVLQLKGFESSEFFKDPRDLADLAEHFVKYLVAVKHGRDLDVEPLVWLFHKLYVENTLMNRLAGICDNRDLPDEALNRLGKMLGIVGYVVSTTNDFTFSSIVAAAAQEYAHPALVEISDQEVVEIVKKLNRYEEVCELAAVFRAKGTKVNWKYFEVFFENNAKMIRSQAHRIALAWALGTDVEVEYDEETLSTTEFEMLSQIKKRKIKLIDA